MSLTAVRLVSVQPALVFWLNEGVDGIQLSGVERVSSMVPSLWADIRAIVQNGTDERADKRSDTLSLGPERASFQIRKPEKSQKHEHTFSTYTFRGGVISTGGGGTCHSLVKILFLSHSLLA